MFVFCVFYRSGKYNADVDFLSRLPGYKAGEEQVSITAESISAAYYPNYVESLCMSADIIDDTDETSVS